MVKTNVILACAGSGKRMGLGINKLLLRVGGLTVFERSLAPFLYNENISKIIITYAPSDLPYIKYFTTGKEKEIVLSEGGKTRFESIKKAMFYIDDDADIVMVHDGARPFVSQKIINNCIKKAKEAGACAAAIPVTDTVKVVKDGKIIKSEDRSKYYFAQTPQAFKKQALIEAYNKADGDFTDDSSVYEKFVGPVDIVEGDSENIKITTPVDICRFIPRNYTVGVGFDTHKLVAGRKLILGGVEIEHYLGLEGHSDADVLLHAIMDSLLSACGERDIGVQFPDSDPRFKDISSIELLKRVYEKVAKKNFIVNNVSAVILAERPRLSPHIPKMCKKIADILNINESAVCISATTTEGMGSIGRQKAISVSATCSLIIY